MAVAAPTNAQFIAAYPEFEDADPTLVTNALARGGRNVDDSWFDEDFQLGIMLYAAHILTVGENAADSGGSPGRIVSESLGRISLTYQRNAEGFDIDGLGLTSYGQQYTTLLRANRGGPRIV